MLSYVCVCVRVCTTIKYELRSPPHLFASETKRQTNKRKPTVNLIFAGLFSFIFPPFIRLVQIARKMGQQ